MLIFRNLPTSEYRGVSIVVRNIEYYFEYIFSYKDKIYSMNFRITPRWHQNLLYILGLAKERYNERDLKNAVGLATRAAHIAVDELKLKI